MFRNKIGWKFDNTYLNLSPGMFSKITFYDIWINIMIKLQGKITEVTKTT